MVKLIRKELLKRLGDGAKKSTKSKWRSHRTRDLWRLKFEKGDHPKVEKAPKLRRRKMQPKKSKFTVPL